MKLPKFIFILWEIYIAPVTVHSKVIAYLILMLYVGIGALLYYADKPNTPSFDKLNISYGIIAFTNKKRDSGLILKQDDSHRLALSCGGGRSIYRDCVLPNDQDKYIGRPAKAWWFYNKFLLFSDAKLAQLEVDNKIVLSYFQQKDNYDTYNVRLKIYMAIFFGMLFGHFLCMPLWYFSRNLKMNGIMVRVLAALFCFVLFYMVSLYLQINSVSWVFLIKQEYQTNSIFLFIYKAWYWFLLACTVLFVVFIFVMPIDLIVPVDEKKKLTEKQRRLQRISIFFKRAVIVVFGLELLRQLVVLILTDIG